jgi:hypothetical protein
MFLQLAQRDLQTQHCIGLGQLLLFCLHAVDCRDTRQGCDTQQQKQNEGHE